MVSCEQVIVVDEWNQARGAIGKIDANRAGTLHRAFSIMLGDGRGAMLLQRRQLSKYHSGGMWANTRCGHPRPGEMVMAAARLRRSEELGVQAELTEAGVFRYRADVGDGLIENEYVHLFHGFFVGDVMPDPAEVSEVRWASIHDVHEMVARSQLAAWFRLYVAECPDFLQVQHQRSPLWERQSQLTASKSRSLSNFHA